MSRSIDFSTGLTVRLAPTERCIVDYYAQKYRASKGGAIRSMIRSYAKHDSNFDPTDFLRWVEDMELTESLTKEETQALKTAAEKFAQQREESRALNTAETHADT